MDDIWNAYNTLLLGPDIERLRKLLARYDLFRMALDVPGDIVECGVFKGTSLLLFLKLLHVYTPGSAKRVIGFDMFSSFPVVDKSEIAAVNELISESGFEGTSPEELFRRIEDAGLNREKCELIPGDISESASKYLETRPGFRISLLHIDLDLDVGTFAALEAFWPRVVPGGVVIFDEYAIHHWTESNAVDRFFEGKSIRLKTLYSARTPSAYLIKE